MMAAAYRTPPVADPRVLVARLPPGVQLFRADRIYGRDHLLHAGALAERAIAQGRARSADLPTESALYVAGERQIGRALARVGLAPGSREVAVLAWSPFEGFEDWRRDDDLLAGDESVLDAFGVSAAEREMLPRERWGDLILERVALLDVLKA